MINRILTLLLFLLPTLATSQEWRFITFEHIAGASNGTGVAIVVGSHGGMLRTDDGGARWDHVSSGSYHNQFSALFLDMRRALVGADSGVMLASDDAGVSWSERRLPTTRAIAGLVRRASNEVLAYTRDEVFRSTDEGESWSPLSGFPSHMRELLFATPLNGVALTTDGRLHHSDDGGASWSVALADTTPKLRAFGFHRDGLLGVAGGRASEIRVTTDGGATWRGVVGPDRDMDVTSVTIDTAGRVAIGGLANRNFGAILYTSVDTGATWVKRTLRPSTGYLTLNRFVAVDAETTLALCNQGSLYAGRANWSIVDTITDTRYRRQTQGGFLWAYPPSFHDSIGLMDMQDMFGGLLRTVDNGATWHVGGFGGDDFFSFELFENGWGLVFRSPQFGGTFHTSDAGLSWKHHGTETSMPLASLFHIITQFFTAREGIAVASGGVNDGMTGYFLRTDDSARTFQARAMPQFTAVTDVTFINRDTGIMTGPGHASREVMMLTEDGGETWRSIYDRVTNWGYPEAVVMPRPGTIVSTASGDAFGHEQTNSLVKSDDMGRSWHEVYTLDDMPYDRVRDIAAFTDKLLYAVGTNGLVLRSEDGGDTWVHDTVSRRGFDTLFYTTEQLAGYHQPFEYTNVQLLDDGRTGIIKGSQGILRIVFPDSLVSSVVGGESGDASIGAATLHVTPNPASSTIRLRVRGAADASSVVLVDNLGRVVLRCAVPEGDAVIDVSGVAVGSYRLFICDDRGRMLITESMVVVR